ncbi:MAG TPA: xanthine dehydrogenase small subunit [Thermoanaerobaculia bacterium]|nr:xanthine dehydrogenase small subunit [Thermoanaerobaculia bacterium]
MRDQILLYVNGRRHAISGAEVFTSLSNFLRRDLGATGTKIVCEEGDCGACTVLIGRDEGGRLVYRPVNSCIQFLFQLDSTHVVTVEGLRRSNELTPVQDAMVRCHGAQCGYCTPGFIVAMTALFETKQSIEEHDVRDALTGNLCRCTGYEPIIRAALEVDASQLTHLDEIYPPQPILEDLRSHSALPLLVETSGKRFARPVDLAAACQFKAGQPPAVIVQGGTDFGVWVNKRGFGFENLLSLSGIAELTRVEITDEMIAIGGAVTLAAFESIAAEHVPELGPIMDRFGSPQIRNAGTLAGNIANASPIADTLPYLYVAGAAVELTGLGGSRVVPIDRFYLGYKKLDLAAGEIISRILIPRASNGSLLRLYKVSKRSHLDISTFTAAIRMNLAGDRIDAMRIAYGGVAPVVLRLPRTEAWLEGKRFELPALESAGEIAREEIAPISDVRGTRDFRLQLAENILKKFYYDVAEGMRRPANA